MSIFLALSNPLYYKTPREQSIIDEIKRAQQLLSLNDGPWYATLSMSDSKEHDIIDDQRWTLRNSICRLDNELYRVWLSRTAEENELRRLHDLKHGL